jgi:transcriptional regulator with XRE-family HTH domain
MPKPPALPDSDARRGLSPTDSVVIDNISRLYREHGTIAGNKSQLARDAEIDPGFISKLLQRKNSVSLTYLHRIAKALGLEPWMLLVPGDWPLSNPPVLQPLSDQEKRLYAKMMEAVSMARGTPTP